jgi:hypothetical protein
MQLEQNRQVAQIDLLNHSSIIQFVPAEAQAKDILMNTVIDTCHPRVCKVHLMSGILEGAAGDRYRDRKDHCRY